MGGLRKDKKDFWNERVSLILVQSFFPAPPKRKLYGT